MPKREPPAPQTGGSIEDTILQAEEQLRAQVEKAKQFIASAEPMLVRLAELRAGAGGASALQRRTLESLPYLGWQVGDAVIHFLAEKGEPQSREAIIKCVLDRGVALNKGWTDRVAEAQIHKSLDYHLMTSAEKQKRYGKRMRAVAPKLKQFPDGRVGIPPGGKA